MNIHTLFLLFVALNPLNITALDLMKDFSKEAAFSPIANDLVYGDGTSEITSSIDEYQNITPNTPIQGSIFVTHVIGNTVDRNSFRLGNKPLEVSFVQTTQMSSTSDIALSIYTFKLDGLPVGVHTLPSISVKVADQEIHALPLVIEVYGGQQN